MKSPNQIYLSSLIGILLLTNFVSSEETVDNSFQKQSLLAVLYMQTSAEFAANNIQTYTNATNKIEEALSDKSWTAALEQKDNFFLKKPAIILDVDETVLNNTPHQARSILNGCSYPCGWIDWGLESSAEAIDGVKDFLLYAKSKDIKIFYVTNRVAELEDATRVNLKALGLPFDDDEDVLLMKGEKGWSSDKVSRRALVASNYRVIMLVGDQITDFISTEEATLEPEARKDLANKYKDMWGSKWFMIPNPMYGKWEGSIYGNQYPETQEEMIQKRLEALKP
ncbi:5'-nucleotidase, lipoprotein e(P4) family [Gammaproteobacteria bacterium]|nr:5'-nucleotidase, lipoprotein e(P4) family [Gammaproteobacteria bacterium]